METLKRLWLEAKSKLTTWIAVASLGAHALAANAESLYSQLPVFSSFFPPSAIFATSLRWTGYVLGGLVIVTRVRRALWPPKD